VGAQRRQHRFDPLRGDAAHDHAAQLIVTRWID
jgi:hypothetical protein